MMHSSEDNFSDRAFNRLAYSRAASGSWIEHGPQTTRRRSSRCSIISIACLRPDRTVSIEAGVYGDQRQNQRTLKLPWQYHLHGDAGTGQVGHV